MRKGKTSIKQGDTKQQVNEMENKRYGPSGRQDLLEGGVCCLVWDTLNAQIHFVVARHMFVLSSKFVICVAKHNLVKIQK